MGVMARGGGRFPEAALEPAVPAAGASPRIAPGLPDHVQR